MSWEAFKKSINGLINKVNVSNIEFIVLEFFQERPKAEINKSLYSVYSLAYQRMSWEALKKSINGLINKVNVSNIEFIVRELFQENIVRGR